MQVANNNKNVNLSLFLTIAAFMFFSFPLHAKHYRVCTVEIPGGITADKQGPQPLLDFYQEVINRVSQRAGHTFELTIAPASRCINLFGKKRMEIMWPFIMAQSEERVKKWGYNELPLYSMPMIMGGYYVFTRDNQPKINHIHALEGKIVVSARGYGVPESLEKNDKVTHTIVNSNEQVPKLLLADRVDAGIIQSGWIPTLQQQGLLQGLHHGEVIDFWGGSFTFHPDQEGAELASVFSNVILQLVVDGTYAQMLTGAPYFIPAYQSAGQQAP